ncbi:MAG TPA: glycosyltransferase, partial [Anaerolineales bacterium]|nr:glycosyltransferase [Anaerolineales bacterium]
DFDLIIWDDGSTDGSWQIIQSYTDPRIRAFQNTDKQRGSPVRMVVEGLETGEYIAIHHSDDAWESSKLEKQIAFLGAHPGIGAVFTDIIPIGEDGEPFTDTSRFNYTVFAQPNRSRFEWLNHFFYRGNALCHPSVLIRRICYQECGLYRYGMLQLADFDLWVRLCLKYEIHVLPEKLFRFRVRGNMANSSSGSRENRIRSAFEYFLVLDHYRKLQSYEEIVRTFPSAEQYNRPEGFDAGFALGMTALESGPFVFHRLFGLQLLFETLNDPSRAEKVRQLYGFDINRFSEISGRQDIFGLYMQAQLEGREQALQELAERNNELTAQLIWKDQELQNIQRSRAWKLVTALRKIRSGILPSSNSNKNQ